LEELENFDGILFAISNLVNNLDSAFERRFLFKVKFENPNTTNASKIWRNKLPNLSVKEALQLATQFPYSGGEMENIARKCLMEEIVFGTKSNFEKILSFCENEKWNIKSISQPIGF
jgi:SpoVK/Ycf46/Vps4 family AAA+-type ATPase